MPNNVHKTGSLEAALQRLRSLHDVTVTVGLQGTSGTTATGEATPAELVRIATDNEFGTRTIPSRPFLRTALRKKGKRWAKGMTQAGRLQARGDVARSSMQLRRVGVVAVGDVQETIRKGPWANNAPATIRAKGSAMPLIDTGQMRQSIRAAVEIPGRTPEVVG